MNRFFDSRITNIHDTVTASINFFNDDPKGGNKKGVYLVIMDAKTSEIILAMRLGKPTKGNRCYNIAVCMATAVYHRKRTCLTSTESRNELGGFPAGAVLCNGLIWAINGLKPKNNEALATVLATEYTDDKKNKSQRSKKELLQLVNGWNEKLPELTNYLTMHNIITRR